MKLCRWVLGVVAFGGIMASGIAWSVLEGVGPVAAYRIEIGNENRPLEVSLHQLVVAWEREHGLMQRGGQPSDSERKSLFTFARASVTRKKVEAKVRLDTAWIPLPATWYASLVTTITNGHMNKEYFSPPMPKPVLAEMVAVEN